MEKQISLYIAYASETGTSLQLVKQFITVLLSLSFPIKSISQIHENMQINEGYWIFFVSTTGQGDPPYSMRSFWKKIMNKNYVLSEKYRYFSVYSLGDSSYGDNFGMAGRKLRQRLKMLGCIETVEIGLGDDQDKEGYRQVYVKQWLPSIIQSLKQKIHTNQIFIQQNSHKRFKNTQIVLRSTSQEKQFLIKSVESINSRENRKVFLINFQSLSLDVNIKIGDILSIYSQNSDQVVNQAMKYFKISEEKQNQSIVYNNKQIKLKDVFQTEINLQSTCNFSFFLPSSEQSQNLYNFVENQMYKEKLIQLSQKYDEYFNYVKIYKRNVMEVIKDFEMKIPLEVFLKRINNIIDRKYSIARVYENNDKIFSILIKLVEEVINTNRFHKGFSTFDLVRNKGKVRKGKILKGQFILEELKKANILITLGTGIAPFLPLMQSIHKLHQNQIIKLFYSNKYNDEVYHRELIKVKGYEKNKFEEYVSLTQEGGKRIYKLLEEHQNEIKQVILKNGIHQSKVMICGPKEMIEWIKLFFVRVLEISQEELKRSKMIVYENW